MEGYYVCIIPDVIGMGINSDQPMSIIQHENLAETGIDFYLAVREFIYNRYHYKLPKRLILFGYSLGGSATWSLARYLSIHKELKSVVKIFLSEEAAIIRPLYEGLKYSEFASLLYTLVFKLL